MAKINLIHKLEKNTNFSNNYIQKFKFNKKSIFSLNNKIKYKINKIIIYNSNRKIYNNNCFYNSNNIICNYNNNNSKMYNNNLKISNNIINQLSLSKTDLIKLIINKPYQINQLDKMAALIQVIFNLDNSDLNYINFI